MRKNFSTQKNYFSIFPKKIKEVTFLVIGAKQGELPAMGKKKEAVMSEFRKSGEARKSSHFTYVQQQFIPSGRDAQTGLRRSAQSVDALY